ncbi:MAG: histidine phosphatase family protein [Burkholderiales bacterium]|nr:histidine phosphatase family protein [Burkholderiales bacterium]
MVRRALLSLLVLLAAWPAHADDALWALLRQGGQIVLIRHAVTDPGVGDPPGFRIDDCATQRNLSEAGRAEATRLGSALRERGVPVARVLSSPWCRAVETARLATGMAPRIEPALANLFEYPQNRERQLVQFRALVAAAPKQGNVLMFTHGSTTLAFTGVNPATAEMVIVTPEGGERYRIAGRIAAPP